MLKKLAIKRPRKPQKRKAKPKPKGKGKKLEWGAPAECLKRNPAFGLRMFWFGFDFNIATVREPGKSVGEINQSFIVRSVSQTFEQALADINKEFNYPQIRFAIAEPIQPPRGAPVNTVTVLRGEQIESMDDLRNRYGPAAELARENAAHAEAAERIPTAVHFPTVNAKYLPPMKAVRAAAKSALPVKRKARKHTIKGYAETRYQIRMTTRQAINSKGG